KQSCLNAKGGIFYDGFFHAGHQCMLAELRSSNGSTRFRNTSARRNMNFVTVSKAEEGAEISAVGYGAPPLGRAKHKFMLTVDTEVRNYDSTGRRMFCKVSDRKSTDRVSTAAVVTRELPPPDEFRCIPSQYFPKGLTQGMTWIARGYRMIGDFLIINGTKYEMAQFVGGFGYVAGHNGSVSEWKQQLVGDALQKVGDNLYTIEIPPEQVAVVVTTIEAVEPKGGVGGGFKRWGLSLHAGVSIPHGNFGTLFNPGPNFGIDLEYRVTPTFSLEGIYGFHHFRGATIGSVTVGDVNAHQFSFNGKVYGSSSPVRPFFNFGGGAY